jgi:hypothetical protein
MDTRIGHDPPHCSPDCATRAGLFVFESAARLQHVKFTHHDKQVKSERILRNAARPKPFVSTVFEGASFSRIACFTFYRQRGGPVYLYHVLRETRLPVSIFSSIETRVAVELSCSRIVTCVRGANGGPCGVISIIDPLGAIDPFARMADRYILPVITFWFRSNGAYSPFPTRLPKFRSQAMIRLSFVSQKGGSSRNRSTPMAESEVFEHTISAEPRGRVVVSFE